MVLTSPSPTKIPKEKWETVELKQITIAKAANVPKEIQSISEGNVNEKNHIYSEENSSNKRSKPQEPEPTIKKYTENLKHSTVSTKKNNCINQNGQKGINKI